MLLLVTRGARRCARRPILARSCSFSSAPASSPTPPPTPPTHRGFVDHRPPPTQEDGFDDEASFTRLAQNLVGGAHSRWVPGRFTVLYDGACPLCAREIAHYQRINAAAAAANASAGTAGSPLGRVQFMDLSDHNDVAVGLTLQKINVSRDMATRRMHVITEDDEVVMNAEAFVEIWKRMPYWRALPPLLSLPGTMWVANRMYDWWAERRYAARVAAPPEAACHIKPVPLQRPSAGGDDDK